MNRPNARSLLRQWKTWTVAAASLTVIVAFQNCSSKFLDKTPLDAGKKTSVGFTDSASGSISTTDKASE